jgi:hypothetical protein
MVERDEVNLRRFACQEQDTSTIVEATLDRL